jgi:DNA-binding SARP family transcriptional activator
MLQYRVIIVQLHDGRFEAYVRAFPSLSVIRPTAAQALEAAREEMTKILDDYANDGRQAPPPDREAVAIELVSVPFEHRAARRFNVQVDVITGQIRKNGAELPIRGTAQALLVMLASEGRDVSVDTLRERLHPHLPPDQAYDALKMNVYRARRQIGVSQVIQTTPRGYRISDDVVVDTRFLPQIVRAIRARSVAKAIETRLEGIFERLIAGRPAAYESWDWFEPIERTLRSWAREIGAYVAERALREGDAERALEIAHALCALDPLDETACELQVRAHLARSDRASALMTYRRYADDLHMQHGMEPSPALRALVDPQAT